MNLAEKTRSAEDTNLIDCMASAEQDQNMIDRGRGKSWMTLKEGWEKEVNFNSNKE